MTMKKLPIAFLLALFACATYAQAPQKTGVLREAVQVPLLMNGKQVGMTTAAAGTKVQVVSEADGKLLLSVCGGEVSVTPEKVNVQAAPAAAPVVVAATPKPSATPAANPELAPFGRLALVDEIDCAKAAPENVFSESPAGASHVKTLLGSPCRVLPPVPREASYLMYRIGRQKGLQAGAAYVLAVEYPEDAPRSMIVLNGGCETIRGFHTGTTVGDALHPKYVDNHPESLDVPLSGRYETWTLLFHLHDRFGDKGVARDNSTRPLHPADGFNVSICQFSEGNDPSSAGVAVRRIRLYKVLDPAALVQPLHLPPAGLPRRHLFWREEMADGVIDGGKGGDSGVAEPLDWYRHKADLMRFLGMHTFTKDLLEFGACQHWDSSPLGGDDWVYFNAQQAPLWGRIVALMGSYGFDVLPYYEYSGSKGQHGLGPQKRAKPLTRDDAYTQIQWVESANADITDPDTDADFKKMLDLTVLRLKDKASFAGVWLRTRGQTPVGFGDATRARFAAEANGGHPVTRAQLQSDKDLYGRYMEWWEGRRRAFLTSLRDYLRANGVAHASVLYTGCVAEPGVGFGDRQPPPFVSDRPDLWQPLLAADASKTGNKAPAILTPQQVASEDLYLHGLLSPGVNWGKWEIQHSQPADDPAHYAALDGIYLTHPFNRLYTVLSPKTLEVYHTASGLALVRHYSLNENMMFDAADKEKLGYSIADIERAGPFCMMAEVEAVANGDPTFIGYLSGGNFGRGFPQYVRDFNANFLALPALPSRLLAGASSDPAAVVVRAIDAGQHGTYLAVVNTAWTERKNVRIKLPVAGEVQAIATGASLARSGDLVALDLRPCQMVSLHIGKPE